MLKVEHISKFFPGVRALDDVSCEFKPGEIHALLGENGAGKSTLMKIICGMYKQSEGTVKLDDKVMNFSGYEHALAQGITVVNQEIQVIPGSSIAENIMLDKIKNYKKGLFIDWNSMYQDAEKWLKVVGLNISSKTLIGILTPGQKQLVQIAKALSNNANYLIMDEPTSSLSVAEVKSLFEILRGLQKKGICVIFISHKLEEVLELCDTLTVLRDGRHVETRTLEGVTKAMIVKLMIGRESKEINLGSLDVDYSSTPTFEVKNISQLGRFEDMNFKAYQGEILGFYGLVGAGRTELVRAVIGIDKHDAGQVLVNGEEVKINTMTTALDKYKIGYVSENRKEEGLLVKFDVTMNMNIANWKNLKASKHSPINVKNEVVATQKMIDLMNIKTPRMDTVVNTLSGGNQQKICIGKWITAGCEILFVDEPTVGVDVGAKDAIHDIIWDLAKNQKKTVILISSDMPELVKLSRRILVFREKKIVSEFIVKETDSYDEVSQKIGEYLA